MNLKKLATLSTQDVLYKESELLNIQRELEQTVNTMKEKEHNTHVLEIQVSHSYVVINKSFQKMYLM